MVSYTVVLALAAAAAAQTTVITPTGQNQTQVNCYIAYNQCRVAPGAILAGCASDYAQCLGFSPFNSDGTNTVTPAYSLSSAVSTAAAPSSTANATVVACQNAYDTCRQPTNGVSANQAGCAADYANCLGYNPFSPDGTNTVTRTSASSVAASTTASASASASAASCQDAYNFCRQPKNGVSANQASCAADNAACLDKCQTQYNQCRQPTNGVSANQAFCAAQNAACLGALPSASSSAYTTAVVTAYTTVCPSPTTFTHGASTYTVSTSTVITLACPGGCTVTKPVETTPVTATPLTTVVRPSNNAGVPTTASTTSARAVYTGAAVKIAGPGALLVGALGFLAL